MPKPPPPGVQVANFTWNISHERRFDWHDHYFNGLYYTDTPMDLALPRSTKRLLGRSILFDARIEHERARAMAPIAEFEAMLDARTRRAVDDAEARVNIMYELTMVAFICLLLSFVAILIVQHANLGLRRLQVWQDAHRCGPRGRGAFHPVW